ncbi:hypothetical protein KI387_038762, partial [Taxus chinensis]
TGTQGQATSAQSSSPFTLLQAARTAEPPRTVLQLFLHAGQAARTAKEMAIPAKEMAIPSRADSREM